MLQQFNLKQIVRQPTRTTSLTATLIDHIIVSDESLVQYTDVLPCELVSDHDAPYVVLNVRKPPFQPRFKYIRNEK